MAIISDLILKVIKDYENKLAFTGRTDKEKMTFGEMGIYCGKINALLLKKGLKKGDCVAVLLDRKAEYLVAQNACLIYGFKIILLDTHYPKDRIDYILNDAKVKVVIDDAFMNEAINCEPDYNVPEIEETDPAIATYTSGSTGKPKGVLHDQGSIADCVIRTTYFDHLEPNIASLIAPFTFIAGLWNYASCLCRGWTCVIVPMDVVRNPRKLPEFIDEFNVEYTYMPPRVLKNFKPISNTLKMVCTGSEKVTNIYSENFDVVVCYGMTETAATVVTYKIDKLYDNTPIGLPLGTCGAYVCDANMNEVEEGEICLTGHFLTEYIGLPEQTAKVKIKNPFKDRDGNEWLYKTGDLGKRLPDGKLLYLNRMDWMIKINGQRVEPGEIEVVMKSVEGVTDALVKDFTNKNGNVYICGYWIGDDSVNRDKIQAYLKTKLPGYMVPAFFVKMDAFPVNQNGKLNRMALPDPKTL